MGVLLWESIFLMLLVLAFWSFIFSADNLMSLLFNSEFIVIILFVLMLNIAIFFNINILFGLSYLMLILGGLELALSILILLI